jgi:hypothetical protein
MIAYQLPQRSAQIPGPQIWAFLCQGPQVVPTSSGHLARGNQC